MQKFARGVKISKKVVGEVTFVFTLYVCSSDIKHTNNDYDINDDDNHNDTKSINNDISDYETNNYHNDNYDNRSPISF